VRQPDQTRDDLNHEEDLQIETAVNAGEPCSQKQAQFVASLWSSCFDGMSKEKGQAYHSCLDYVWNVSSANDLTRAAAHVTINWLFSGEYVENDSGKDEPVLNPGAVQETRLILREALKEKGQMDLL